MLGMVWVQSSHRKAVDSIILALGGLKTNHNYYRYMYVELFFLMKAHHFLRLIIFNLLLNIQRCQVIRTEKKEISHHGCKKSGRHCVLHGEGVELG